MTDEAKSSTYKVSVDQHGCFTVEAPSKTECIELLKLMSNIKVTFKIDEAIR